MITEYFMYICISTYKIQFGHYSLLSGISPQAASRSIGSCKAPQHRTTSQSSTTSLHQSYHNHLIRSFQDSTPLATKLFTLCSPI